MVAGLTHAVLNVWISVPRQSLGSIFQTGMQLNAIYSLMTAVRRRRDKHGYAFDRNQKSEKIF